MDSLARYSPRLVLIIAALVIAIGVVAAQRPPKALPSASLIAQSGQLNDSIYTNKLLGLTVNVPEGWSLASEEMNKALLAVGGKKMAENEAGARRKALEDSIARTAILFTLSKFPIGTPGNSGNLACGFERIPVGFTLQKYSSDNQSFLLRTFPTAKITNANYKVTIGGKVFGAFDLEVEQAGILMKQSYYILQRNSGMLFFVKTWSDDDEIKKGMDATLATIKFDR